MNNIESVKGWLDCLLEQSSFDVVDIPLSESIEWHLKDGFIRHKTGRFFKVIGVRWVSSSNEIIEQPLLDQHEIGTLGFLIQKNKNNNQILVQAKIEPGNIGVIQLSPTCQATYSNAECVHGGKKPPFSDYFDSCDVKYDLLQSEQGTRFYRKRNKNVLAVSSDEILESHYHKWLDVDFLLDLLKEDYLVNTDARSVLVCSPWKILTGRAPFSRYKIGFGKDLAKSFSTYDLRRIKKIKKEIISLRCTFKNPEVLPLDEIKDTKKFHIKHIKVKTKGREVSKWDQPIISSVGRGMVILPCGRRNGVTHFLFKAVSEPGLQNKFELSPFIVVEPGENKKNGLEGKTIIRVRQSEEGGRFFQDENVFQIIDIGEAVEKKNAFWLTLGEIKNLLSEEGWFTNESRSALSLLLPWL